MNDKNESETDDLAIDHFADAMKEKLLLAREKGRSGWQHMKADEITLALMEHLLKGDPVDIANYAMFLHQTGEEIDIKTVKDFLELTSGNQFNLLGQYIVDKHLGRVFSRAAVLCDGNGDGDGNGVEK